VEAPGVTGCRMISCSEHLPRQLAVIRVPPPPSGVGATARHHRASPQGAELTARDITFSGLRRRVRLADHLVTNMGLDTKLATMEADGLPLYLPSHQVLAPGHTAGSGKAGATSTPPHNLTALRLLLNEAPPRHCFPAQAPTQVSGACRARAPPASAALSTRASDARSTRSSPTPWLSWNVHSAGPHTNTGATALRTG
jgi:hypothetical protein